MNVAGEMRWMSAREAAALCGVPATIVHYWRRRNVFKRIWEKKLPTGRVSYKFPADEVERIAEESKPKIVGG